MHRDYRSNTPTKFYQYRDRLEIVNPGGLYGNARPEKFPDVNDYRNPVIADALRVMGYVNKFNRGIARVQNELVDNGNGRAFFAVDKVTVFSVNVTNQTINVRNIINPLIVYRFIAPVGDNRSKSRKVRFEATDCGRGWLKYRQSLYSPMDDNPNL